MREIMLITHMIGLAMGLGTSFAFMFLGIAAAKMEKEEAINFTVKAFTLRKMGNIGLGLLFISGGYLMTPYWSQLTEMPTLLAKLILFIVLGALLGILGGKAKKAQQGNPEEQLPKIKTLGRIALLVALTIVVLAVLTFN
ncbi:MAG: hypothetical protein JXR07_04795 [Reichenbachiella sp.]